MLKKHVRSLEIASHAMYLHHMTNAAAWEQTCDN